MIGLMPGPRDAAEFVADRRAERVDVDLQPEDRVRDHQRIGAGGSAACATATTSPALGDSFTHTGLSSSRECACDLKGVVFVQREIAATGIAGRAGDIDLNHVDIGMRHFARHGFEIVGRGGRNRSNQRWGEAP